MEGIIKYIPHVILLAIAFGPYLIDQAYFWGWWGDGTWPPENILYFDVNNTISNLVGPAFVILTIVYIIRVIQHARKRQRPAGREMVMWVGIVALWVYVIGSF